MLFLKSFIKFSRTYVIVFSLTLTACMSTSDESEQAIKAQTNQSEDKQEIETSFVKSMFLDMLTFWQDDEENSLAETGSNSESDGILQLDNANENKGENKPRGYDDERLPAINLYQEQKTARLAGVPAHIIASYQQALNLMKKQQWAKASTLLDEVILTQGNLSGPYLNKAKIALHRDKTDLAFELVDKAIKINGLNLYAHAFKAQLLSKQGRFTDAERSYIQALEIWPDHQSSLLNLAILLELYRGKLHQAETYYLHYLSLQPDDQQVKMWYGALQNKLRALKIPAKSANDGSQNEVEKKLGE